MILSLFLVCPNIQEKLQGKWWAKLRNDVFFLLFSSLEGPIDYMTKEDENKGLKLERLVLFIQEQGLLILGHDS